jgi:putative membrane protein
MEKEMDLELKDKLALQQTVLANHRTLLSFLRTSMYFLIAGLSIRNLLKLEEDDVIHLSLYIISGIIFVVGIILYFTHKKKIRVCEDRIGKVQAILNRNNFKG